MGAVVGGLSLRQDFVERRDSAAPGGTLATVRARVPLDEGTGKQNLGLGGRVVKNCEGIRLLRELDACELVAPGTGAD